MGHLITPDNIVPLVTAFGVFVTAVASLVAAFKGNAAANNTKTSNGTNLGALAEQIHAQTSTVRTRGSDTNSVIITPPATKTVVAPQAVVSADPNKTPPPPPPVPPAAAT